MLYILYQAWSQLLYITVKFIPTVQLIRQSLPSNSDVDLKHMCGGWL